MKWLKSQIHLTFASNGTAEARGVSLPGAGRPGNILVAGRAPVDARCADVDGDGVAGLIFLQFDMLDVRSGELAPVSVFPTGDEDIDDRAEHEVIVVVGATTVTGRASFHQHR